MTKTYDKQTARRRRLDPDDEGEEGEEEEGGNAMHNMFRLPRELSNSGSFDQVKAKAMNKGVWLIIHVHDPSEFSSQRLVRDVWSHETLKEILLGSFVFWQTLKHSAEGQRVMAFYKLEPEHCPHIIIVDPVTGQKMKAWSRRFIDAEKLMEEMIDFTAHGYVGFSFSIVCLRLDFSLSL